MYSITVAGADGKGVLLAQGSLSLVNYAVRELRSELVDGQEYQATLTVVDATGNTVRTLASLTGDADTLNVVLARKIRKERAAQVPAE